MRFVCGAAVDSSHVDARALVEGRTKVIMKFKMMLKFPKISTCKASMPKTASGSPGWKAEQDARQPQVPRITQLNLHPGAGPSKQDP